MKEIELFSALAAGFLSFFSPCVLPLLPGFLSLISGVSAEEISRGGKTRSKAALASLFFVAGFTAAFTAMGFSASLLGGFFSEHRAWVSAAAGIVLVFFGLHLAGAANASWLNYEKKIPLDKFRPGLAGAFLMGLAFAIGWSPCIGPILAGILALASARKTGEAVLLLLAYSAGMGLPFVAAGFAAGKTMAFFSRYKKFVRASEVAAGIILIALGLALLAGGRADFLRKFAPV